MNVDNEKHAKDYVKKEIEKRLVRPIDGRAYQWIVDQIAYYRHPAYLNTDYTNEVLKILDKLVDCTKIPGRYKDKDYMLLYLCIV